MTDHDPTRPKPVAATTTEARSITGPDDFARVFSVSPDTIDRLKSYESVFTKWQRTINLAAPSTLPHIWSRHFADSLQIAAHVPQSAKKLADLGSGGGFPGLVLAAHFADRGGPAVTLVESDLRKAAFLREAARAMEISVEILSTRIENNANLLALSTIDVFTARALAHLRRLFEFVAPFRSSSSLCIFLKGRDVAREIDEARQAGWTFELVQHQSVTDSEASIVVLRNLASGSATE